MDTDTLTTPRVAFSAPSRYNGPPGIANGGWLCGQLAAHVVPGDAAFPHPAVEVTLRAPTPVDRSLAVEPEPGAARLLDGEQVLAEARLADASPLAPAPVDPAVAALAEAGFVGWWDHPFVDCYVCGLRQPGEGLRLFTGPVEGRPGVVAGRFTVPTGDGATGEGAGGVTPTLALWAALDCPTGWAHHRPGGVALLGRLTGQVHRPVAPGEELVVVAQSDGQEGRRLLSRSGIYDLTGRLVAAGLAVWVTPLAPR